MSYSRDDELAGIRAQCREMDDIYDDIAADDLRDARRKRDRTHMMHMSVTLDSHWAESSSKNAIKRANEAAAARAMAAAQAHGVGAASRKKRPGGTTWAEYVSEYTQDLSFIDVDSMHVDKNCDQVRSLVRKVLDNGIMKKGKFCGAIGNTGGALNSFLAKNGPLDGAKSEVYQNSWGWFKQRELAGLKMPDPKKQQVAASSPSASGPGPTTAGPSSAAAVDISRIVLEEEATDTVPVYDSCDEIRSKIDAHMRSKPGLSPTQFCRDLAAQLHTGKCKSITVKQLADFRSFKGSRSGSQSPVYYAAYIYFEKIRLAQGQPKSTRRLEREELVGLSHGLCRWNVQQ